MAAALPSRAPAQSLPGTIRGRVILSGSRRPAAGARVTLERSRYTTETDSTGRYELTGVSPGAYVLQVSGPGLLTLRRPIEVPTAGLSLPELAVTRARDTARLAEITVYGSAPLGARGSINAVRGAEVYSGKKTEVLTLDSLDANVALNVTREVLGRIPGANIAETEGTGFPSNGLAYRGLDPVQSVEMNTRQDGVNIAADIYGYPETYYTPPMEAVERIELIRGSSSLQFGPQFGGVVNYVMRDGAPNTRPSVRLRQTVGSFGTLTTYASVGGGTGKWTYFAFGQFRGQDGWRPHAELRQVSGAARIGYQASDRLKLALEYSLLRNRLRMPGGLTDAAFAADARQSLRARNWLRSPWNIVALSADWRLGATTRLVSTASLMLSGRDLVWRNEDGGAGAPDEVDPATGTFVPREVERERFGNVTSETRLLTSYRLFGGTHTIATGMRFFTGSLHRQEGGRGTTGTDFDLSLVGPYEKDVRFTNSNVALFAENIFRIGGRLAVTPGIRYEFLHSTAAGHTDTTFSPQRKNRAFVLLGLGAQFESSPTTTVYANVTQAYRPIAYSFLAPIGSLTRIDPHMRDPRGLNADLGMRGRLGRLVSFDVSGFLLLYRNRIGLVSGTDPDGTSFTERTNVASSRHAGVESYVELRPFSAIGVPARWGGLSLYDAFAWVRARYTSGPFEGHTVEYAPAIVNRAGLTYAFHGLSTTLQVSHTSRQFGDANNTVASDDAAVGLLPAYDLVDWSATWHVARRYTAQLGVNNLTDARYITRRTDEYPGPGIIPGSGRSVYVALGATF